MIDFPEGPADASRAIVASLLEMAGQLHDAALDPARWPEVLRAARLRLSLDRATGELSAERAAWLESIIESATHVCAEVARLELARTMAGSAIDTLSIGVMLVDGGGRLLRANPEAERLLRTVAPAASAPSAFEVSEVRTSQSPAPAGLPNVAALARAAIDHHSALPLVSRIVRAGAQPLEALAVPVSQTSDALIFPEARVIVFLLDPDRHADADETALATTFQLTPAEARLAVRLVRGDTLQEGAGALGIKTTTARTHLARLFAKTGTYRQPELVRLLVLTSLGTRPRPTDGAD